MILFKLVFGIIKKILLVLSFISLIALIVTFFIAMANNGSLEGGFWNAFTTLLGEYHFGDMSTNQRMVGVILMIVGLIGGVVFSIIAFILKKAGTLTALFGIVSIAGAIVCYPTLDGTAIQAFFGGSYDVMNYVVVFTLSASLTMTLVGLYHLFYGLSARIS